MVSDQTLYEAVVKAHVEASVMDKQTLNEAYARIVGDLLLMKHERDEARLSAQGLLERVHMNVSALSHLARRASIRIKSPPLF